MRLYTITYQGRSIEVIRDLAGEVLEVVHL